MKLYLKTAALVALYIFLFSVVARATNYYVSGSGSDSNNGLSTSTPFASIPKGASLTNPGDTIFIMNGTYATSFNITRSGSANGGYIVYKNYPGHKPKIKNPNAQWNLIYIKASYIVFDGIELEGNRENVTYEQAYAVYEDYITGKGPPLLGYMNCNGISVGKETAADANQHHIIVRNCTIHDFTASGSGAGGCDYVTYENNRIFNNAWYTQWACSGISVIRPYNSDNETGYKIFVRNNIVYNNKDLIPWVDLNPRRLSDGNGIIIDVNNGGPSGPTDTNPVPAYNGRTLVENNVVFNNGGSGIHAYGANHVDIINNTAYYNGTVMNYGNIYAGDATDCKILNNIMYAKDGGRCNTTPATGTTVTYDYNIYYNGTVEARGPHDIIADPKFVNLSIDPTVADFRLKGGSPAINSGANTAGSYSTTDINGVARPISSRPEVGAYEFQSGTTPQTITFAAALPTMAVGAADYDPGATASSGLSVMYRSSNVAVATIINNKIQIVNGGTCTITATQGGDATYGPAADVSQSLTVTGGSSTNLITNPTFDTNTTSWNNYQEAPASFTYTSAAQTGYSSNVATIAIGSLTTSAQSYQLQISQNVPLIAGKTYSVKFKASASAARTMDIYFQQNVAPKAIWKGFYGIALTTTPKEYSYLFTASTTDNTDIFKFLFGTNSATVYLDDVEVTIVPSAEINVRQEATKIADDTGSYSFGSVDAGSTKEVTFTVENLGDKTLNLLSTTKAIVSGTGFSLVSDATGPILAGASTSFKVKFSPALNGNFSGTVTIPNDDTDEGPYSFTITGTGINGAKAGQTIVFNALSKRNLSAADFNPGATATSGLPVTYTSLNPSVATIVNGLVHIIGSTGTAIITASQAGDLNFNPASNVSQVLTVDANMIGNAYFDTNTSGWGTFSNSPSIIAISSVSRDGYAGNVLKATLTNGGTTNWFLQLNYPVNVIKDKTYAITFKASADVPGNLSLAFQKGGVTLGGFPATKVTTTPTSYGPYYFNSNSTDAAQLKLYLGELTGNVYVDDVEMYVVPAPEMNVKVADTDIVDNTGIVDFGDVATAASKTIDFKIENLGEKTLTIEGSPKVKVSGKGFSLVADAPASIDSAGFAIFKVTLTPDSIGVINGTISISSNDISEYPYNFAITGKGICALPAPNASSVTANVGATNVVLTVTNCTGTVSWNGIDATASLPISTTATGTFSYSTVCKVGSCLSPVTVVTATILPATPTGELSVYHRDADNGQLTNNTIRPYLKLYNAGTTAVPYSEITARYWLTAEDFAPVTNLSVYWAELGTTKVKIKYVTLPQPRQGAFGYIEYSFDASAGNLAANSNSGEIQTGIGKQNWTNFNEADDYSYKANATYTQTDRITVYRNNILVGGIEPSAVAPITTLKVYAQNKNTDPGSNQISTYLKVANEGNLPADYSKLTVRYWFTVDGDKPLVYTLDFAELGNNNVSGKFVKQIGAGADTYLELSFAPTLGMLYPLSSSGLIQQRVNKSDWSVFNEANDYSYKIAGPLAENTKITAYLNGTLVYGQEPGVGAGRLGLEETSMQVRILGNPVIGDKVDVAVSGIEGQPLRIQLTDIQGRVVSEYQTGQASAHEQRQLIIGEQRGVLLLQVSTPTEKQTLKVLKQ